MPAGAVIAARQALGQYLVYAPPWQRRLIGVGVVAGGTALLAVVTGPSAQAAGPARLSAVTRMNGRMALPRLRPPLWLRHMSELRQACFGRGARPAQS